MNDQKADSHSIRLVALGAEHLAATCRWLAESSDLRRQIDCLDAPTPEGNAICWAERWQDSSREDYAILHPIYGHIGNCGLQDIDRARHKAQMWIYLGSHLGEGLGKLSVLALLHRGFGGLGLARIYLRVLAENIPAISLYHSIGFVLEGRARCDTIYEGKCVDALLFSMLASEYRAMCGEMGSR